MNPWDELAANLATALHDYLSATGQGPSVGSFFLRQLESHFNADSNFTATQPSVAPQQEEPPMQTPEQARQHPALRTAMESLKRAMDAGHLHPQTVAQVLRDIADDIEGKQQQPSQPQGQ